MKNNTLLAPIFLLLLLTSFNLTAQDYTSFDLSDYYTPDISRNMLELNFGTNGGYNNNETSSTTSSSMSGNLNALLHHYHNTRRRVSTHRLYTTFEGNSRKYSSPAYDSKESEIYPSIDINTHNRFYNSSNTFLLAGGTGKFQLYQGKTHRDDFIENQTTDIRTQNRSMGLGLRIGGGKGRLESVEDARQAVYIVENLSKNSVLKRKLSSEELFTLSQLISSVKNRRFFDSRLHRIDEITEVDSFFVNNHLLERTDASYFTVLYDYWEHGALFERLSGTLFESYLSADILQTGYTSEETALTEYTLKNKQQDFFWNNMFYYEHPKNLYWQNSALAGLNMGYRKEKSDYPGDMHDRNNEYLVISLKGNYGWSYYPNSRTSLLAWINQDFTYRAHFPYNEAIDSSDHTERYFTSKSNLNVNANYYISPQIRLSTGGSVDMMYLKGKPESQSEKTEFLDTYVRINIALSYFIY